MRNKCSACGSKIFILKAILASRIAPVICNRCGKEQYRRHDFSKVISFLGAAFGLFTLLFLFMAKGLDMVVIFFAGYWLLLISVYVFELFIFDLSEYGDKERNLDAAKSKQNVWFAVLVVVLGIIFYVFDM